MEQKIPKSVLLYDAINIMTPDQHNELINRLDINRESYPPEYTARRILMLTLEHGKAYVLPPYKTEVLE